MWLRIAAKSATPAFLGIRRWHVDMRLMRTGSISRDRTARYRALETILDRVRAADAAAATRVSPTCGPPSSPTATAHDEIGDRWAAEALAAGTATLRRDVWGVALLAWHKAGPNGRARMRAARDAARGGVYRVAARVVGG